MQVGTFACHGGMHNIESYLRSAHGCAVRKASGSWSPEITALSTRIAEVLVALVGRTLSVCAPGAMVWKDLQFEMRTSSIIFLSSVSAECGDYLKVPLTRVHPSRTIFVDVRRRQTLDSFGITRCRPNPKGKYTTRRTFSACYFPRKPSRPSQIMVDKRLGG